MNDEFYMNLALNEAWKHQILTFPNPAVGCAILDKNGQILSVKAHEKAGNLHAEANAVLSALCAISPKFRTKFADSCANLEAGEIYNFILENHENLLFGGTAFVTLEPCAHFGKTPPCANLLRDLGFKKVVISVADKNKIASGGAEILKAAGIGVKMGVCENEGRNLIEPFLRWSEGNFTFFKLAMTANGVISGGKISSLSARTHMHKIRDRLELLAIGGNTVRFDRPTLDSRLCAGKAPNVFIYSKRGEFDQEIPLFNVKNRSVKIGSNLDEIRKKRLVMIEGGENFMRNLPEFVEHFLIYFGSGFKDALNLRLDLNLEPLHIGKIDDFYFGWFKKA